MLPAILLGAVVGTTPFPLPATYRYAASLAAQRIGEWTVSVKSASAGTEVDENSSASFVGMQVSAVASLMLGPDLAPAKYIGSYHMSMQNPSVSVTLTSQDANVVGAFAPQPQHVTLAAGTHHFVVIEPGLLAGLFALPAQLAAWKENSLTWITPATAQSAVLAVGGAITTPRPPGVPPQDLVISVERPMPVTIWYDPATFVPDEVVVPSQNATLTRERP
ncbi:MAG: hypothetical protein JOZ77_12950 [Candidatus Eremiobacteraeota bacterium]|nr:hypothetical protein [Candidatus Eremiobacteraeota bacterium]